MNRHSACRSTQWVAAAALLVTAVTLPAWAQTPASGGTEAAEKPAAETPPPGYWINGIHLSAQIEAGIVANPAGPKENFGHLFTDRANQPILNQILLTANKPLDPKATDVDWGFKLQFMYGADARYTHFLGEFDRTFGPQYRNQIDVVEANVLLHLPFLTEGGIDIKAGQYSTPIGFETIDPATNPFYTHSYIFNFGIPLKHTGFLTTTHVNSLLDIYLGLDTGVNTTFGPRGDNNGTIAGIGGFGLNMMDGNLTVLALTHIGPENASRALAPFFNADKYMRYLNDVIVTWKASDKLTLVTEANWIRDDFLGIVTSGTPSSADAFGIAQYLSYTLSDTVTFNLRGEVYRDDKGVFVFAFPGNLDFLNAEQGFPNGSFGVRPTTFGAITAGFTFKPEMPAPVSALLIRPEIRYDTSLNGTKPYNRGRDAGSLTIASDFVLTF
jgi:hypothetical protein